MIRAEDGAQRSPDTVTEYLGSADCEEGLGIDGALKGIVHTTCRQIVKQAVDRGGIPELICPSDPLGDFHPRVPSASSLAFTLEG